MNKNGNIKSPNHPAELEKLVLSCEAEQLHLSGAIQPFGALLRIDTQTHKITHASANLVEFIGLEASAVLGQPAESLNWIKSGLFPSLPETPGKTVVIQKIVEKENERVDGLAIRGTNCILVELEKINTNDESLSLEDFLDSLSSVRLDLGKDALKEHHQLLVDAFRAIIGYDRVMIYRFHEDWTGEVVAEATSKTKGSYLGLHFPSSDIPAIARNLYLQNPARMIPDAKVAPISILSKENTPPDLTRSDLRSVSPVHLQYLENMGVAASFSVPIRSGGNLWGLVACHHSSPLLLSPEQRSACVKLTDAYSKSLMTHLLGRRMQTIDGLNRRIDGIMRDLANYSDLQSGIHDLGDQLLETMEAQGFAMAVGKTLVSVGEGPSIDQIMMIDDWFLNQYEKPTLINNHLEEFFLDPQILQQIRGLLAIKSCSPQLGWIRCYWFRPELKQEVAWAGNPNKPMMEKEGVLMLSPRSSFKTWMEIKSGYSRPWSGEIQMVATKFRSALYSLSLRK